ncbi:hypothetical protein KRM28CT15_04490 [Krasilnikovia sp. M28-CT-15]
MAVADTQLAVDPCLVRLAPLGDLFLDRGAVVGRAKLSRVGARDQRAKLVDAADRGALRRTGVQVDDGGPSGTRSESFDTAAPTVAIRKQDPSHLRTPNGDPGAFAASVNASSVHTAAVDVAPTWTKPPAAES